MFGRSPDDYDDIPLPTIPLPLVFVNSVKSCLRNGSRRDENVDANKLSTHELADAANAMNHLRLADFALKANRHALADSELIRQLPLQL
jgi:hypothetical protein